MRINLSEKTLSELEEASGRKITKNGDEVILEVAKMAQKAQDKTLEPEITVCNNTEEFASMEDKESA